MNTQHQTPSTKNLLTRFAPSPTGYLHIGNVRTALLCYLFAKKNGGEFMLRIDDTDKERSKEEYVDGLKEDLTWLGLIWDKEARQSERFDNYHAAVEKLKEMGRIYTCYETGEELDIKRKMQLGRGQPPIYDRAGLNLTEDEIKKFEDEGRKPHYRFKLEEKTITWNDMIRGPVSFEGKNLSDPILIRADGSFLYMLPSTVDDVELGVTHIMRGEDHVSNTAVQIQLFEALGGDIPEFAHNSLIKTKEGKLSKRDGGFTLRSLREDGMEPMAINSFLAKVGTSENIDIRNSLKELANEFDTSKFSKNPTMYSVEDIERLNKKVIHQMDFNDAKDRLDINIDEEFWNSVRPNLSTINEIQSWWKICKEDVEPDMEDFEFTSSASELLPDGDWTQETWGEWIGIVKDKTGRKGKELFMPIRKAITGMDHGPELKNLLPLIGREKVVARLNGKAA
jgi:glutamyl-tRNA synthetase